MDESTFGNATASRRQVLAAGVVAGGLLSSSFPPAFIPPILAALPENPHIKFFDGAHRGYVRNEVTRSRWRADFRAATSVTVPDAPVVTAASFEIQADRPGLVAV